MDAEVNWYTDQETRRFEGKDDHWNLEWEMLSGRFDEENSANAWPTPL